MLEDVLKKSFNLTEFRAGQKEIISTILAGNDALAVLPTGAGKSLCFQFPAIYLNKLVVVISPLIALMKDQVYSLIVKGIPAGCLYSGQSEKEKREIFSRINQGGAFILYLSPERVQKEGFQKWIQQRSIALFAIDEAHCVSQWGHDFREEYAELKILKALRPEVPVLALTASATKNVQDDICDKLSFSNNQQCFQQSFERPNLSYSTFNAASKQNKLLEVLNNVPGTAIVYCKSRRHTKDIADLLKLKGINADFYHAGLNNEERNSKQESWINNTTRVIVCTNAFGMGIDKPNVRVVVHYDVPDCLENYYQEAGRAGRDGKRAYAVLLYNEKELQDLQQQSNTRFPDKTVIKKIYTDVMNHLQIPAGSGEAISYDFDIAAFASAFKTDILIATYSIKALEQEGVFIFSDTFFKPSTVVFTCTKEALNDLETQQPSLDVLAKALLRSYEGVFDFPVTLMKQTLQNLQNKAGMLLLANCSN